MTAKEIGTFGEDMAVKMLEDSGIQILKRNFHCRAGELDIIARDGETIVFAEVKTRLSRSFGSPGEFVDYKKQEKIIKTALFYTGRDDLDMRFDVIEVLYCVTPDGPSVTEINHIKNAF